MLAIFVMHINTLAMFTIGFFNFHFTFNFRNVNGKTTV